MGKGAYYYAVHLGTKPGVYTNWSECEAQIKGFSGAKFKKFKTKNEAELYVKSGESASAVKDVTIKKVKRASELSASIADQILLYEIAGDHEFETALLNLSEQSTSNGTFGSKTSTSDVSAFESSPNGKSVEVIYTDGASRGNGKEGARAGFGVYFGEGDPRNVSERLQGTRQTNQRAELMAAIRALEKSNPERIVEIRTDSKYLVRGLTEWLPNWLKEGWVTSRGTQIENRDLFEVLSKYVAERTKEVRWVYVPAHSGIFGNEAADQLAVEGAYLE